MFIVASFGYQVDPMRAYKATGAGCGGGSRDNLNIYPGQMLPS
jgi:hypothetical protein